MFENFSGKKILPKNIDSYTVAQCDFFAVESLVQMSERPAMRTIEPMNAVIFQRKLSRDIKWRETFDAVCAAYKNLYPRFQIKYDSFGGYKLIYSDNKVLMPSTALRRNPIGFLAPVANNIVTDLSVMSSERTGETLLLLGPLRFLNSDCEPNCEYDYSSDSGFVQLRVRRRVNPGDELFVKYGPEFFEANACRCRTCDLKRKEDIENSFLFDLLLQDCFKDVIENVIEELERISPIISCTFELPKRKRLRGRELIELFNEVASSPQSDVGSPVSYAYFSNQISQRTTSQYLQSGSNSIFGSDSDEDSSLELSTSGSEFASTSDSEAEKNDSYNEKTLAVVPSGNEETSTRASPARKVSLGSSPSEPISSDSSLNHFSDMLFEGSQISVDDATVLIDMLCSRFNFSDECSTAVHSLIKVLLPQDNKFPSAYSHIKKMKKTFEEEMSFLCNSSNQSFCVLNFRYQLRNVVQRHLASIFSYTEERRQKVYSDFNAELCPFIEKTQRPLYISLLLSSDGVNIKKSTFKKELWPVWVQIANLPPKLRMSRNNIVLAALYVGDNHPHWNELVPLLKSEIISGVPLKCDDGETIQVNFKFILLVSDLGAKSHMLNMFKFNGYYGCHYCTAQGKTIGITHAYYPFDQIGKIRYPSLNDEFVELAENFEAGKLVNVVGVKGRSPFSVLIEGLPLTAPVDYMHCVLIGVFTDLLKLCFKKLSSEEKIKINITIAGLRCPREMIAYSRKIRPLDEISQFKANELFNWLFYLSPILFLNRLTSDLLSHLNNLVFGVRLIFESSYVSNVKMAEKLLNNFCQDIVSIHDGNERIETINVHCLRHLADQVARFGPLYCYSAMSFEAANRTLSDVYSGSHSECEVICRRVLQRHKLADTEIRDPNLRSIFFKLSGISDTTNESFSEDFFAIPQGDVLQSTSLQQCIFRFNIVQKV